MRHMIAFFTAVLAVSAHAQVEDADGLSWTSPAEAETATPAAPTPPPSAKAEVIYEDEVTLTDDYRILIGTREATTRELFQTIGRADLLERSDAAITKRKVLFITAGAVLVVLETAGVIARVTAPNLVSGPCNTDMKYYNEYCQPTNVLHQAVAGALMAGGAAVAGILAVFGLAASPDVLNHWELRRLIDQHNDAMARRSTLRLVPTFGASSVGLVATGQF